MLYAPHRLLKPLIHIKKDKKVFIYLEKTYLCCNKSRVRFVYNKIKYLMFNKETEYALRSLVYIQRKNNEGHRPGIDEITEAIDAPRFYTAKILQNLVRQGFLLSQKGRGGGFFFDTDKAALPIRDVILSTEGDKVLCGCGFGMKHCDEDHPCALHNQYAPIRASINQLVSQTTIQSLAMGQQTSVYTKITHK